MGSLSESVFINISTNLKNQIRGRTCLAPVPSFSGSNVAEPAEALQFHHTGPVTSPTGQSGSVLKTLILTNLFLFLVICLLVKFWLFALKIAH